MSPSETQGATGTAKAEAAGAPADPTTPPKASHPTKGRRFRVLDGDGGDVCIVRIIGKNDKNFPAGTMLPIPEVPRFETSTEAVKWIKNDSGDLLKGMQVMVFQAKELMSIKVENTPKVTITSKPKRQVSGPPVE
jgi:hypothetical protein